MAEPEQIEELQTLCPGARAMSEGGQELIHLPTLKLPPGSQPSEVEGLLCPTARDGYATRLFLSSPVAGRGANWTVHHIANRTWHTWSWRDVSASQSLVQILLGHLDAFR